MLQGNILHFNSTFDSWNIQLPILEISFGVRDSFDGNYTIDIIV